MIHCAYMPPGPQEVGGGFSEGELKLASFWVQRRGDIIRLGYGTLIVLNVVLYAYVLWGLLDAFAISYPRESRITSEIAANQIALQALESDRPKNISASPVTVLTTTDNRLDMAVDIDNPNELWWADFTYRFNVSGAQTTQKNGFIMPASKSVITELGYKPTARGGSSAQFVVESVRWHRLDPKQVDGLRYKDFENQRFNVSFENLTFKSDLVIGTQSVGRTSFDIVDRGAYGFWSVDLVIRLYRSTTVVAINKINIQKLLPGETRHVDVDWFDKLPSVTRTEIIPVVNFLDPASYLPTEYFRQ
jgi:hypothetical protein